jgi:hypothetical protein
MDGRDAMTFHLIRIVAFLFCLDVWAAVYHLAKAFQ